MGERKKRKTTRFSGIAKQTTKKGGGKTTSKKTITTRKNVR